MLKSENNASHTKANTWTSLEVNTPGRVKKLAKVVASIGNWFCSGYCAYARTTFYHDKQGVAHSTFYWF